MADYFLFRKVLDYQKKSSNVLKSMKDSIENKLESGEELLGHTETPFCFCMIKRDHELFPIIIKGFDPRRNEFYEKFWACSDAKSAHEKLKEILTKVAFIFKQ